MSDIYILYIYIDNLKENSPNKITMFIDCHDEIVIFDWYLGIFLEILEWVVPEFATPKLQVGVCENTVKIQEIGCAPIR